MGTSLGVAGTVLVVIAVGYLRWTMVSENARDFRSYSRRDWTIAGVTAAVCVLIGVGLYLARR